MIGPRLGHARFLPLHHVEYRALSLQSRSSDRLSRQIAARLFAVACPSYLKKNDDCHSRRTAVNTQIW